MAPVMTPGSDSGSCLRAQRGEATPTWRGEEVLRGQGWASGPPGSLNTYD